MPFVDVNQQMRIPFRESRRVGTGKLVGDLHKVVTVTPIKVFNQFTFGVQFLD